MWENDKFLITADFDAMMLGDVLARSVGEALRHNRRMTMLWLNQNRLGSVGARALAAGLEANTAVTEVRP